MAKKPTKKHTFYTAKFRWNHKHLSMSPERKAFVFNEILTYDLALLELSGARSIQEKSFDQGLTVLQYAGIVKSEANSEFPVTHDYDPTKVLRFTKPNKEEQVQYERS